jgi:sugar transferase EpsL
MAAPPPERLIAAATHDDPGNGESGSRGRSPGLAVKRAMDVAVAAIALVVLSPIIGSVAIAVRSRLGTPVFFRQLRPGLDGRPFMMLKFRTMSDSRDETGAQLPDAVRLTPLGRFLRLTSLDELPELVNVLRGEMSLVGPRPLLMDYLPRYTPRQRRRHAMRPGITGLAQVSGRQNVAFSRRLELDVWYVDNWSLALDVRILCQTLLKVLRFEGVKPLQDVTEVDDIGLYGAPPPAREKPPREEVDG